MIIKQDIYDGEILQDRFAYDFFKKEVSRTGNILCFTAPMRVGAEFMVDKEDLVNNDYIFSGSAMNFLIEIPDISLYAGICFQRLFNTLLKDILNDRLFDNLKMKGDDILVDCEEKKKLSVSIAKQCNGAVLIHTGVNINAGEEAPSFAYSTNFSDDEVWQIFEEVTHMFKDISHDIFIASTKILK